VVVLGHLLELGVLHDLQNQKLIGQRREHDDAPTCRTVSRMVMRRRSSASAIVVSSASRESIRGVR
jgi:hypothetical protein